MNDDNNNKNSHDTPNEVRRLSTALDGIEPEFLLNPEGDDDGASESDMAEHEATSDQVQAPNGDRDGEDSESADDDDSEEYVYLYGDSTSVMEVYAEVTEDEGELLGDPDLFAEVKARGQQSGKELAKAGNSKEEIKKTVELVKKFNTTLNKREHVMSGAIAHCRILLGLMLIVLKDQIKDEKLKWEDFFAGAFGKEHLRSAQNWMALARIPKILDYVYLGLERLLQIWRAVKDDRGADPIGDFLREYEVPFNPQASPDVEEGPEGDIELKRPDMAMLNLKVNTALVIKKFHKRNWTEIDKSKVETLVSMGVNVGGKQERMAFLRENGGDLNAYLTKLILSGGKDEPETSPKWGAEHFNKTASRLVDTLEKHAEDDEYLRNIKVDLFNRLKRAILKADESLPSSE